MRLDEQAKVAIVYREWGRLLDGLGHSNSVELPAEEVQQTMADLCTTEGWKDMPSLQQCVFPSL